MGFSCGIIGLPNAGKSTIFNALTALSVAAQPYPFCTIEPNVGIVPVPDDRLSRLADLIEARESHAHHHRVHRHRRPREGRAQG